MRDSQILFHLLGGQFPCNVSLHQDKLNKILLTFEDLSPVHLSPESLGVHILLKVIQTSGYLVCHGLMMPFYIKVKFK